MDFEDWDGDWTIIDTNGKVDLEKGDVVTFEFNNGTPDKIKIKDVTCSHGKGHGKFWKGVICSGSVDTADGKTNTSSTQFKISSTKRTKEELDCSFSDLPLPEDTSDAILGAATWTAQEGANGGGTIPGQPGQEPPAPPHRPRHA